MEAVQPRAPFHQPTARTPTQPSPIEGEGMRPAPTELDLFVGFLWASVRGFGGVFVMGRRMLVEERQWLAPDEFVELLGVCLNIANMRTKHARQTLDALRERFGDKLFRTVIRQSIAYAESAERAVPILGYRPDRGSDYLSLASEILRRYMRRPK